MSNPDENGCADEAAFSEETVEERYQQLVSDTAKGGYFLNPDTSLVMDLVRGMCTNRERYGYEACPCRFCIGSREHNLDIICPCFYRDEDLTEFGSCFCGLFVAKDVAEGDRKLPECVPERRDPTCVFPEEGKPQITPLKTVSIDQCNYPVYRCRVCGYLCARKSPSDPCPICGAEKDRFETFSWQTSQMTHKIIPDKKGPIVHRVLPAHLSSKENNLF